jgi:hypothetical protein
MPRIADFRMISISYKGFIKIKVNEFFTIIDSLSHPFQWRKESKHQIVCKGADRGANQILSLQFYQEAVLVVSCYVQSP